MWRRARIIAVLQQVSDDVAFIRHMVGTLDMATVNGTAALQRPHNEFVARSLRRFISPLADGFDLQEVQGLVRQMHDFFANNPVQYYYDGTGDEPRPTGKWKQRVKLWCAFGMSPIRVTPGYPDQQIVIRRKAWLLPEEVFAGVLFHEATHFVLGTDDSAGYATFKDLSELAPHLKITNADNWRMFYQEVRAYKRRDAEALAIGRLLAAGKEPLAEQFEITSLTL